MTSEPEVNPEKSFIRTFLPWLVAAGALALYLATLNHWISLGSLPQVARLCGWTWQPELHGPLFWLVTYPFRWLPSHAIPLALNFFAAICAALTLALLARSVVLLPHDRTHEQRQKQKDKSPYLSIPAAWLPPVLAVLVCGLQLTFWEHATTASSQPLPPAMPWGTGCEMLDLLVFAYIIRCLLEFRLDDRDSWLMRAAFAFGLGMTGNWAMIGFLPVFLMALVWLKGLGFFNMRFLGRMSLCGLAGLLLYLLLPLLQVVGDSGAVGFWPALKANLGAQRSILMLYYKYGRQVVALLALTSLVPLFIISIRWASYFGDSSRLGVLLATFMFHVVHGLFLLACIWVAFDPPFSPRNRGFGAPFLTFYYLGALCIGYCSGYFLLLFGGSADRTRRQSSHLRLLNNAITVFIWLLFVLTPLALICRNWTQIRTTNGPALKRYAEALALGLPAQRSFMLTDDPRRAYLLQAYAARKGQSNHHMFLETAALQWPEYHRFLHRKYPQAWESNPPREVAQLAEPLMLAQLVSRLAQTNSLYYLHPSFGYYFEFFHLEPHGLIYELKPYSTNYLFAPPVDAKLVAENESFWAKINAEAIPPLLTSVAQTDPPPKPGLLEKLAKSAHLVQELNQDAATVAKFYSRALNYWGVEIQKTGRLTNAAAHFERALELNPDNIVAQINLECNRNQRVGRSASVQVSKSIEDEFGKYRNWDQVIGENGPFDEPNFCFEQGRVFVRNSQYRQAAAQFDRVKSLAPNNLDARNWLGQLYVVSLMPAEALRIIDEIHAQPDLAAAAVTNRTELLFVETSAHLGKNDPAGADAVVQASLRQYPNDMDLLATATQVYLKYGRFSNALSIIEQELILAPTNVTALINQGYACIQVGAFEKAIPALTQVLTIETNNHSALLNRAIAYLRANKLAESKDDYERLQKVFPTASQISYGLGEIAWRKRDTNAAIRNYELYLANAPTNTVEAKSVIARLMELKPGAR